MQFNTNSTPFFKKSENNPWIPDYPNPADFRFNYHKLMANATKGIAKLNKKVAIVGAGSAGMAMARELMRCGCEVSIFESSDRIGGRLYTELNPNGKDQTGIELGAMRMPFFAEGFDSDSVKTAKNSLLGYYLFDEKPNHSAIIDMFPNPGNAYGGTGIYVNKGLGPDADVPFKEAKLISWDQGAYPDDKYIEHLTKKVDDFILFFTKQISKIYVEDSHKWEKLWKKIVEHYDPMTFIDLVMAPSHYDEHDEDEWYDCSDGDLGGMGMSEEEASVLYTIGTGDGSWGAFYSIGALWWIRCTMFGYVGKGLQTIVGYSNTESLPYYNKKVKDSAGKELISPRYEGMQGFVEYLYYVPVLCSDDLERSLYEDAYLYIDKAVDTIEKLENDQLKVYSNGSHEIFDHVVVTTTQWKAQLSIQMKNFSIKEYPLKKKIAQHSQHYISSCKFFFPLKTQYWKKEGNKIPQILVTDEFIQDAYAFAWNDEKQGDKGVILASYTWEDDSMKLLAYKEEDLAKLILEKLKEITLETLDQDITQYIDGDKPVMIQWVQEPNYLGCSKLYRQKNQESNLLELSYNQNYAGLSKVYFAGESYSVEGGWTEPALRSSIDAVIQMVYHNDGEFIVKDFNYKYIYPKWPVDV